MIVTRIIEQKTSRYKELINKVNKIDIVDILHRIAYGEVKQIVNDFVTNCVFHSGDDTASLRIYTESNSFYCFGCLLGGDVVKFVTHLPQYKGKKFLGILEDVTKNYKDLTFEVRQKQDSFYSYIEAQKLYKRFSENLENKVRVYNRKVPEGAYLKILDVFSEVEDNIRSRIYFIKHNALSLEDFKLYLYYKWFEFVSELEGLKIYGESND